jgi:hypothetical protein
MKRRHQPSIPYQLSLPPLSSFLSPLTSPPSLLSLSFLSHMSSGCRSSLVHSGLDEPSLLLRVHHPEPRGLAVQVETESKR